MSLSTKTSPVVTLAGQDFAIKSIPVARVVKLGNIIMKIVNEASDIDTSNTENMVQSVIGKISEFPYDFLKVFIKNLPEEIFKDEENGVTFPEFYEAVMTIIEVNRFDVLKNLFSRLMPAIQQQMQTKK